MAIDDLTRVIGVFRDRTLAQQAVQQLRADRWREDQIDLTSTEHTSYDLTRFNLSDEDRRFYQHELDAGYVLVAVDAGDRQLEAQDILHRFGGYHITAPHRFGGERTIPIREEQLAVTKQAVQIGEIRIHKRVITEEKTITVPVTREEITIERMPVQEIQPYIYRSQASDLDDTSAVSQIGEQGPGTTKEHPILDRPAGPAGDPGVQTYDAPSVGLAAGNENEVLQDSGIVRILVHEEQIVIDKRPVVVEEIIVRKQSFEENRHIAEPVRHEEVTVERVGDVRVQEQGDNSRDLK